MGISKENNQGISNVMSAKNVGCDIRHNQRALSDIKNKILENRSDRGGDGSAGAQSHPCVAKHESSITDNIWEDQDGDRTEQMFLETPGSMLDQWYHDMEVEMEESYEEPEFDLDIYDDGNQLEVIEYVEDLYAFYRRMEICSFVSPDYMSQQCGINQNTRAIMIDWLIQLCLVEYEMVKFPPSLLAAASVYTAQCSLYGLRQWSKTCEWHSKYSEDQLLECSKMIVGYHQRAATGRCTGVYRKYNTSKFGYAAKCEPAKILVEDTNFFPTNNPQNQNNMVT